MSTPENLASTPYDSSTGSHGQPTGFSDAERQSQINGFVYVAVAAAAIGGLLFGYDTGVISGALIFVKEQFSLAALSEEIVVSAVLVGAVLGAILGGAFTGRYGRRKLTETLEQIEAHWRSGKSPRAL